MSRPQDKASLKNKRQKVCVQGLGFVGAAMAAAAAEARTEGGEPAFDVVGMDLATPAGLKRVNAVNAGQFPFETTDRTLSEAVGRGKKHGNLRASTDPAEYEDCDVVIVDIHLDVDFDAKPPRAKFDNFLGAVRTLGARIPEGALILIETTVPPGTTGKVVAPEIAKGMRARGLDPEKVLIAHSYERVMPGRDYLASITKFWRVYSGHTEAAAQACEKFLTQIIDTKTYPLTRLAKTTASEIAKLMENSYRATNIAFINEWSRLAEEVDVDLFSVIKAIRLRPTHQNMMRPGLGVGGYCLTKDPLLVGVGARDLFGLTHLEFPFSEGAVATNYDMPRGTVGMLKKALGGLGDKRILLLGASYREDVADTRYSPTTRLIGLLQEEGVQVQVHDPLVREIEDCDVPVIQQLPPAKELDAIVFIVAHEMYRKLGPEGWITGGKPLIVDSNGVLSADQVAAFQNEGCKVKIIGRGDL